ncbi:MAG: hypothetical protein IKW96_08125 [Ruminococcus sp.]|uniref:hypothetical protein n=1 Tax=Ruminococcus sp. TaxID=41978 RepID=UPI0025ECEAA1|nr:hypothetical protein [Ruminococcus sp.]MBR5683229.1 hypothetical protein [Ruminococcus sp.]
MASITVDWNVFDYKFSGKQRETFESLAYTLFCFEFKQKFGIFRYFNQPYIETQPIKTDDGDVMGFQAKYYDAATKLSSKKKELIEAIDGAKDKYAGITKFIIYTNKEFSTSKTKGKVKPDYQDEIENHGKSLGINIEWRVPSHIEAILYNPELCMLREFYFDPDSTLRLFAEKIQKRTVSIISNIKSEIPYKDRILKIDYSQTAIHGFTKSNNSALVVYGNAGTGKSGYVKDFYERVVEQHDTSFLAFSASDFDVKEETSLFNQFGNCGLDGLISLYESDSNKYCLIESAEKYSNFFDFDIFRNAIHRLIESGWKIIITIRKQYKNGFINAILDGIIIDEFCIENIDSEKLTALSGNYDFELPSNKKVCGILCNLFYLKLYLELLSAGTTVPSDTKVFTEQIWKQFIRNDRQRQRNLPIRREAFIENMASTLLNNEAYCYKAQASDDEEVLSLLEEQGIIIPYGDTPGLWVFSHDVYEEIVVNHILEEKYDESYDLQKITDIFANSLRSRKMYRIWLETKLKEADSNLLSTLSNSLVNPAFQQLWKDETIIALMNAEDAESFSIMESLFSLNTYELFTRAVFLLNTACKCVIRNADYLKLIRTQKISTYRFTEPTGRAWNTIFNYIVKHINLIPWHKQNLSIVIEAMGSWVRSNPTGETTRIVGHIALSLKDKLWQESELRFGLYDDSTYKSINTIILLAAIELKDELAALVDNIISNKSFSHRDTDYVFLTQSLSNIYECGKVCDAIPEKILQLAWTYWLHKEDNDYFSSPKLDSYFGFNDHIQFEYYPPSAYQTPIWALLQADPKKTIDFIIGLTNKAATAYKESALNEKDGECDEIQIILNEKEMISQICSDRLWKIYRGTGVATNLIESLLMAFEKYVLLYVEKFPKEVSTALCLYMLRNSNNVAITAVVMSAVIAYPNKLFEVSCILLKTKELFFLDRSRFLCEHEANMFRGLRPRNKIFDNERLMTNKKEFRKKAFEDIILQYQVYSGDLSKDEFKQRRDRLYSAIDNASIDIDKWHPIHQACFYRIDLRKYKQVGEPIVKGKQLSIPMKADMPPKVIEYAEKSSGEYASKLGDTALLLWASSRYKHDEKYKTYSKYEDSPISAYEAAKTLIESDKEDLPLLSIDMITYTIAVLLRDFSGTLDTDQYDYCKNAILELGFCLVQNSSNALFNHDVKAVIMSEISNMVNQSDNDVEWTNPIIILLAFMLDYRKQIGNNMIYPLSGLWKKDRDLAFKLIIVFSKLIASFNGNDVVAFVDSDKDNIADLLSMDEYSLESIDLSVLDYNTRIYLSTLLDSHDTSIVRFVITIGEQFWEKLFHDTHDDRLHRIFELENEYKKWLAEYLLNIYSDGRSTIIQTLMPLVGFNREFDQLLSDIVNAEDINPRYDAFWDLWTLMQDYFYQEYEKNVDDYKSINTVVHIGYGYEDVLATYLLYSPFWKENTTHWHSLKPQNNTFYFAVANRLGYNPTILFAISQVLNTVGKTTFIETGIDWINDIITNNPHLYVKTLPDNTLYYIEEYIFSYMNTHVDTIQTSIPIKRKVVKILDFLISKGSTMGFLLKEELI